MNVMFRLYWIVEGKRYFRGSFDTFEKAIDKMNWIIDTESNIKSHYIRMWEDDIRVYIDYGAHNSKFIIES